jgi:hypothetical protein
MIRGYTGTRLGSCARTAPQCALAVYRLHASPHSPSTADAARASFVCCVRTVWHAAHSAACRPLAGFESAPVPPGGGRALPKFRPRPPSPGCRRGPRTPQARPGARGLRAPRCVRPRPFRLRTPQPQPAPAALAARWRGGPSARRGAPGPARVARSRAGRSARCHAEQARRRLHLALKVPAEPAARRPRMRRACQWHYTQPSTNRNLASVSDLRIVLAVR